MVEFFFFHTSLLCNGMFYILLTRPSLFIYFSFFFFPNVLPPAPTSVINVLPSPVCHLPAIISRCWMEWGN